MKKITLSVAFIAAFCLAGKSADAAAVCSFTSVSGVTFPNYDVFSAVPATANGLLVVTCNGSLTGSTTIRIVLSKGNSATYTPRFMNDVGQHLNYNLYLDPGLTTIWGNGTGGTSIFGPTPAANGVHVNATIYGRVPAGQDVKPLPAYLDKITATVEF